jgi:hypothetical protein
LGHRCIHALLRRKLGVAIGHVCWRWFKGMHYEPLTNSVDDSVAIVQADIDNNTTRWVDTEDPAAISAVAILISVMQQQHL